MKLETLYRLQEEVPKSIEIIYFDMYKQKKTKTFYTKDIIPDCIFNEEVTSWYLSTKGLEVYL